MTQNIKKILFTTDLSQESREVFGYAVNMARKLGASISMIHVLSDTSVGSKRLIADIMGKDEFEKMQKDSKDSAQRTLLGKKKEVPIIISALTKLGEFAEIPASSSEHPVVIDDVSVIEGGIIEEIIDYSMSKNCDLIIMGLRCTRKPVGTTMGSTTKGVLLHSDIPVFTIPLPR